MPEQELKTARHLLSRCFGAMEFYADFYTQKNGPLSGLCAEIKEFLWPEEGPISVSCGCACGHPDGKPCFVCSNNHIFLSQKKSPTLDSSRSVKSGAQGGEPCGTVEGHGDGRYSSGQVTQQRNAARIATGVDFERCAETRVLDASSGYQAPPAGEVSAPIRITEDNGDGGKG